MPNATLPGYPATSWTAPYGGKPATPNPILTAGQATTGNIGNLGQLYSLATNLNRFNNTQAPGGLNANLPDYQHMIDQSSHNIGSLLKGEVPNDVLTELLQTGAERGIATGSPGSPNANASFLRALGLTSLDLMGKGEQELTGAIARTPTAKPWDPSQFFVTPGEQQAAEMHAANVGALPDPAAADAARRNAITSGVNAGFGAVPGAPHVSMPSFSTSWGGLPSGDGVVVGNSTSNDLTAGGLPVSGGNGEFNWQQWVQSITPQIDPVDSAYSSFMQEDNWLSDLLGDTGTGTTAATSPGPVTNMSDGGMFDNWLGGDLTDWSNLMG